MSGLEDELEQKGEQEVKEKVESDLGGSSGQQGGGVGDQQQGGGMGDQQQGGDPNQAQDQGAGDQFQGNQ